jgi:hypothetical protein
MLEPVDTVQQRIPTGTDVGNAVRMRAEGRPLGSNAFLQSPAPDSEFKYLGVHSPD